MLLQVVTRLLKAAGEREHPDMGAALPSLRGSGYPAVVLDRLMLQARDLFGADEACIFVRDSRRGQEALVPTLGVGLDPELLGQRLPMDFGPVAAAVACGGPLVVPGFGRTAAVAPFWFGGRLQGAVSVAHHGTRAGFDFSELQLLGEVAQLVERAVEHTACHELSWSDPQVEIEGLLETLAQTEPTMGSHGADVASVASWLGDRLELSAADRLELEFAAHLHDVGKLRVPQHILWKAGPLSESEWALVRLHPVWGAEMVAAIPGLEAVALIVRCHHERWDGSGYPQGLSGEQIPLASRIIALCDAYCAMTVTRPYRQSLSREAAFQELEDAAGVQFDPDLTNEFMQLIAPRTKETA